jgi:hypothetical protein
VVARDRLLRDRPQGRRTREVQRLNAEEDGPTVFAHACKMGLEGSVAIPQPTEHVELERSDAEASGVESVPVLGKPSGEASEE